MPTRDSRSALADLLQPSLTDSASPAGPKPFRVASLFWIAFVGGAAPIAVIASINARRLNVAERQRWFVLVGGILAVVASVVAAFFIMDESLYSLTSVAGRNSGRIYRMVSRGIAVLYVLGVQYLLKPAERAYDLRTGGEHASLWGPGLLATVGMGGLQAGLTWLLLELSR
jgi:hypothetical protein